MRNYYRDGPKRVAVGGINYSIRGSKSFGYKTNITGKLEVTIHKKSWNCCAIKTFKQFLETSTYTIN